jgi:hypothetical protein
VSLSQRFKLALKAIRELGLQQVGLFLYYQFALYSGLLRLQTPAKKPSGQLQSEAFKISEGLVKIPKRENLVKVMGENAPALLAEAKDIDKGKVRLFGGPPQDLILLVPLPLEHWTEIALDQGKAEVEDIKFLWEPARFTWVYTLARAYILSEDERYVEAFWREFEAFIDINLPNLGPNWVSGQEIAIRLIAFSFAYEVFNKSNPSSPERINRLGIVIADHAARIPPTITYARAQNNNHLLSEAVGLITAGHFLQEHPKAVEWRKQGWHWFKHAIQAQIGSDGTYIQHSTNYHRLMLQLALWVFSLEGDLPEKIQQHLALATSWLSALIDPETGRAPNLGHNDGAYLQPLASCSYHDHRPVLQAAGLAFLGERMFSQGPWDELSMWLGIDDQEQQVADDQKESPPTLVLTKFPESHIMLQNPFTQTRAYLRTAHYRSRPGHADQLHLDLWWRGHNVAQDAGTYLYNAPHPWENSLAMTGIHNTVTINDREQMTPGGRFLWLDWAQAQILKHEYEQDGKSMEVVAQHDGYREIGLIHRRAVKCDQSGKWLIKDQLLPYGTKEFHHSWEDSGVILDPKSEESYHARLHWLLPDWSWKFDELEDKNRTSIQFRSPHGWINLHVGIEPATKDDNTQQPHVQLVRAGESLLDSDKVLQTSGWVSPTYGYKIPALSFAILIDAQLPIIFRSQWEFPQD